VGPGLGRTDAVRDGVAALFAGAARPMVLDGDALWALSSLDAESPPAVRVLTPHDGEYRRLTGDAPGGDRIEATRRLAADRRCTVLLKGPTTVVADPRGRVSVCRSGDQRLATAGTGDVLTGIIAALLAAGLDGFDAARAAALVHGAAALRCDAVGMVASDLLTTVPAVMSSAVHGAHTDG
jgi:NAD(P)H-hydrate epimerase